MIVTWGSGEDATRALEHQVHANVFDSFEGDTRVFLVERHVDLIEPPWGNRFRDVRMRVDNRNLSLSFHGGIVVIEGRITTLASWPRDEWHWYWILLGWQNVEIRRYHLEPESTTSSTSRRFGWTSSWHRDGFGFRGTTWRSGWWKLTGKA